MYGSVLWNPNKKGVIEALEKIQHLFLGFLSYKTKIPMNYSDHDYDPIMKLTNIKSLENSRAINDLKFLFKLNNHHIISPDLYENLKSFKPYNPSRNPTLIFIVDNKKLPYSVIHRICYLVNLNKNWIKFKDLSLYQFINLIYSYYLKFANTKYLSIKLLS